MANVKILEKEELKDGWKMKVRLEDLIFEVTLKKEYWEKLTGGKFKPEEIVLKSFQFLLDRESKESILGKFDLFVIQKYFPEYEQEIKKIISENGN